MLSAGTNNLQNTIKPAKPEMEAEDFWFQILDVRFLIQILLNHQPFALKENQYPFVLFIGTY